MKVLFVQTDSLNEVVNSAMHIYNFEPLGLYYLASTIKGNHDVDLIDLNSEYQITGSKTDPFFNRTLMSYQPDVVAFSALTSVRTGRITQLSSITKAFNRRIVTIVGGVHASLSPSDFRSDSIDLVIAKDSIVGFPLAISMIEKGLSKKTIQRALDSPTPANHNTLCGWPKPFRGLGKKYKACYKIAVGRPGEEWIREKISSVKTSSECPFRCNFCCLWQLYPKYEKRNVADVVSDIEDIDTRFVFLADDESLIDVRYMNDLADSIRISHCNKRFVMYARSDTIMRNPRLIEKWAAAGLRQAWVGLEGATDAQLQRYHKRNTTKSHESAIKIARQNHIDVHATVLVDTTFNKRDFKHVLTYTKDILGLTSCHFFVLTPFKGTGYYSELRKSQPHKFLTQDPDHFSIRQLVLQPEHMTISEFHQHYADLQRDFNSDTIPFSARAKFANQQLQEEFKLLRSKNAVLYEAIAKSHICYT